MSRSAISIKNLSKRYSISKGKDNFLALDNINLEIEKGKVMGLIGPNGAGKSTLLKILARITYPSAGNVSINGRLASLLEVGTGFHPELTGRENIYLNGSILGMSKKEITTHFDEILEFSGVSKFIDTPVKHYSSGMYVRLAFSVAAHLDSDILLIDEVLAVGDAQFQKKCLAKMNEATQAQNRTVVFVSHNMSIARNLCDEIAYLEEGKIQKLGDSESVTNHYLQSMRSYSQEKSLTQREDRSGNGTVKFSDIKVYDPKSDRKSVLICGEEAEFEVHYGSDQLENIGDLNFHLNIFNDDGYYLATLSNQLIGYNLNNVDGKGTIKCHLKKLPLMAGNYYIKAKLFANGNIADIVDQAVAFEVLEGDYYNSGSFFKKRIPGIFVEQDWLKSD